jgi:hypothetical protein
MQIAQGGAGLDKDYVCGLQPNRCGYHKVSKWNLQPTKTMTSQMCVVSHLATPQLLAGASGVPLKSTLSDPRCQEQQQQATA